MMQFFKRNKPPAQDKEQAEVLEERARIVAEASSAIAAATDAVTDLRRWVHRNGISHMLEELEQIEAEER